VTKLGTYFYSNQDDFRRAKKMPFFKRLQTVIKLIIQSIITNPFCCFRTILTYSGCDFHLITKLKCKGDKKCPSIILSNYLNKMIDVFSNV